jgi:hypothetical protein
MRFITRAAFAVGLFLGLGLQVALAGSVETSQPPSNVASLTSSGAVTSPFFDGGILNINGPTGVECVAGFDSPDSTTVAVCFDQAGGVPAVGVKPRVFWNTGAGLFGLSNLAGHIQLAPGSGNRIQTTEFYYSSIASGSCAFSVATEGAKVCTGPDTAFRETGTFIEQTNASMTGTAGSGTGITANHTAAVTPFMHKVTVTEAALTDADNSQDITVWTVPAKAEVHRMIMDVTATFTGGSSTDADIVCGYGASLNEYVDSADVDGATGTYGDANTELGPNLEGGIGDVPSWSATTAIKCRFTNTGDTLANLTTGSATFYIEGAVFP